MTRGELPRVGVGVPVYNGERYLAETLDALLAQTWEDCVILVGDNASTDRTGEIALDYATRDPRVRYVRHERNIGAARNYSDLFHRAGTEFFRWQAADDLVLPEYTAHCVGALDADPGIVLAYCATTDVDGEGRPIGPYEDRMQVTHDRPEERFRYVRKTLQRCNALYGLMRSRAVARTRLMQPFIGSDATFLAELALYGKFVEIPDRLFLRRYHGAAASAMDTHQLHSFYTAVERPKAPVVWAWRHLVAYHSAISRAPLAPGAKMLLHWEVSRLLFWWRHDLAREAGQSLAYAFRRLRMGT